jgi:hypothetical protein
MIYEIVMTSNRKDFASAHQSLQGNIKDAPTLGTLCNPFCIHHKSQRKDSNFRSHAYQACALPD